MKQIKEGQEQWEKTTLKKVLDRSPERQAEFRTESGIPVKRLYSPQDLEGMDYDEALGYPGQYPYTRGIHRNMFRAKANVSICILQPVERLIPHFLFPKIRASERHLLD